MIFKDVCTNADEIQKRICFKLILKSVGVTSESQKS